MNLTKKYFFHLFVAILISFIWVSSTSMVNGSIRFLRWLEIGVVLVIFLFIRSRRNSLEPNEWNHYSIVLLTTFILLLSLALWNNVFRAYYHGNDFGRDIFRGAFSNLRAPLYTTVHLIWGPVSRYLAIMIVPFSYLTFLLLSYNKWSIKHVVYSSTYLFLAIICYGLTDGWYNRVLSNNVHFLAFLNDSHYFNSIPGLFSNYVSKMELLGRSSHYPPGNVLLFMLEARLFPSFAKLFVMLSTVLSIYPLVRIMRLLKMDVIQLNFAAALFVFSTSIPSFPSFALTPITIFFSLFMTYYLLKFLEDGKWINGLLSGAFTVLFMFFSYAFTVIGLLMFCVLLLSYLKKRTKGLSILKFSGSFLVVLVFSHVLLYLLTGFNQLDCLLQSLDNNSSSMSNGFDDLKRYLLRSSGNVLAYFAGIGIPILGYAIFALRKTLRSKSWNNLDILIIASFLAMVIAGFSGLFFLETSRIWLPFTPFICIAAANALLYLPSKNIKPIVVLTLALTLLLSVSEELIIDHGFKYFSDGW